jgi:hypothetical protein
VRDFSWPMLPLGTGLEILDAVIHNGHLLGVYLFGPPLLPGDLRKSSHRSGGGTLVETSFEPTEATPVSGSNQMVVHVSYELGEGSCAYALM